VEGRSCNTFVLLVLSKVLERMAHTQKGASFDHLGLLYKDRYALKRGRNTTQAKSELISCADDAVIAVALWTT